MIRYTKHTWLVRLAYLMPLISGIILLTLGFVPHLFYISGNNNPPTLSPFQLLDIIRANGMAYVNATASGTTTDFYFYVVMLFFWALSVICIAFFAMFVVFTTVMLFSVWTPQNHPTEVGNKLKRAYRILIPNRGFFVFYLTLPLIPSLFPHFFQLFCKKLLGQAMQVYYYGIPDWIIALILAIVSTSLFLTSLSAQKNNKMDLFRIYKRDPRS